MRALASCRKQLELTYIWEFCTDETRDSPIPPHNLIVGLKELVQLSCVVQPAAVWTKYAVQRCATQQKDHCVHIEGSNKVHSAPGLAGKSQKVNFQSPNKIQTKNTNHAYA